MIRLVGDIHGKFWKYYETVKNVKYSIQLGDFGWRDSYELLQKHLDPNRHKVLLGNHEDYDYVDTVGFPHNLGNYGTFTLDGQTFFFLRGAFSIDMKPRLMGQYRTGIKSWFEQEELSHTELKKAIELYKQVKPDLVLTHDTPQSISELVGKPEVLRAFGFDPPLKTTTQIALQTMFDYHQPKQWYFGHYHREWGRVYDGTMFKCLSELEYVDI